MKLTITREDLRQFVLKEANIDIIQAPMDIEIEGFLKDEDYVAKEILARVAGGSVNDSTSELTKKLIWGDDEDRKVITDKEGRVLDIVKTEKEPKKAKIKDNRYGNHNNLKNHPDYTDYRTTVLDFATSSEHKRQVPFFGAETLSCVKERYRKIIKEIGVSDSVKFSRINSLPYLVKIEGTVDMAEEIKKGFNG